MNDLNTKTYFSYFRESLDHWERPSRVIIFVDIVGSTEMKAKGEVAWLPTVGKFYDVVIESVRATGGQVVKYLGDGALAVFSDDAAANAINAAVRIQEQLEELRQKNTFQVQCSIGITTGTPVEFLVGDGIDYI